MSIDQRLHRAANDLRAALDGLPLPDPPRPGSRRRRPAVVALLAAVVALAGVVGGLAWLDRDRRAPVVTERPPPTPSTAESIDTLPSTATTALVGDAATLLDPGPLSPRGGHSVVWTGTELIVWGGWGDEVGTTKHGDGAAYNPSTEAWRVIAPAPLSPRRNHAAAWTGTEMIIVGGDGQRDGAAYDPAKDRWRSLAQAPFPIGGYETAQREEGQLFVDGGLLVWQAALADLARYDVEGDTWVDLPAPPMDNVQNGTLRAVGTRLIALGTAAGYSGTPLQTAISDLRGATGWERVDDAAFDYTGQVPSVDPQWSGDADGRLVVWSITLTGATLALDPTSGTWTPLGPHGLPSCEGGWGPVELDGRLLATSCLQASLYEPAEDAWTAVDLGELALDPRSAAWTGTDLLVWGGACCYGTGGAPFQPNQAWSFTPPPR